MFKDTKEALERLESVLLGESADEEPTEALPDAESLFDDHTLDALLSDDQRIGDTGNTDIYKNYSNGYRTEDDDDKDYEDLRVSLKSARDPVVVGLTVLALMLVAGILGVLLWALISFRGLL